MKARSNTNWFRKDGSFTRRWIRLYCDGSRTCDSYVMIQFYCDSMGYANTRDGKHIDLRNQCYVCDKHKEKQ